VVLTGRIAPNGAIGPVGEVPEEAGAVDRLLIWIIISVLAVEAPSKPVLEKCGIKVLEVANIEQALRYLIGAGQSIG